SGASRPRQEAAASAAGAGGAFARRRDGAAGGGELSDRAGYGVQLVDGRLLQGGRRNRWRDAADAALDAARAGGGISPGAASECDRIESMSAALSLVMPGQKREARLRAGCPGHPRLSFLAETKTWMAGSSPAMTA